MMAKHKGPPSDPRVGMMSPVQTEMRWNVVEATQDDGSKDYFVLLTVETPVGISNYFLPRNMALAVANGIGNVASQMPGEDVEANRPGLIVPNVDMGEVLKGLENGKG